VPETGLNPSPAAGGDLALAGQHFPRPAALDKSKNGPNLAVLEVFAESRHGAVEPRRRHTGAAFLGVVEQHLVRMVPSMATFVVGRRLQRAVGVAGPPVGLPLQVVAVTRCAVAPVGSLAERHHLHVSGVGVLGWPAGREKGVQAGAENGGGGKADNYLGFGDWVFSFTSPPLITLPAGRRSSILRRSCPYTTTT